MVRNLIIEAPTLSDEAAAQLEEFFYALMDAFGERYQYQTKRYYRESVLDQIGEANNLLPALEKIECEDPPF